KVKIAAVTASVYLEERQAFFNAGACDIVNKPYRNEEIFDCMAKHLGVRFLYAEDEDLNKPSDETMRENVLDQLKQQPSKWLKSFELSAIELDVEGCLELVKSIGADDSESAEQLSAMINHFEFDLILQLLSTVQQTMKES
ncbi:MAG TPA: hybrid sensor histidine kinase/response regulator, partial [Methylococcaceae bacterium]|nr:hybrid sensor histidine kinase/response regulator [Methylococcaceae bacterium]